MKQRYYLIIIALFFCTIFIKCSAIHQYTNYRATQDPEFAPYDGPKVRIAILDFDNYAEKGGAKFGSAISDRLVSLLLKSGRFIIVERQRLNEILTEQALGQSGAINEETATQVGTLLGVQALIMGDILEASQESGSQSFSNDDDDDDKWAFALKATVAHVKFFFRMVDTATGEILFADNVTATDIRPGFGLKTKEFDFTDMFDFDDTILGNATRKAIIQMAEKIVENSGQLKWSGKIVKVKQDSTVYFTPGRNSGVKIGDQLIVYGRTEVITEEENYQELTVKATIEVTGFVGEKVAKAVVVDGDAIKVRDIVEYRSLRAD